MWATPRLTACHVKCVPRINTALVARKTTPSPVLILSTRWRVLHLFHSAAALSVLLCCLRSIAPATMGRTRFSMQQLPWAAGSATPALRQSTASLEVPSIALLDIRVLPIRLIQSFVRKVHTAPLHRRCLPLVLLERMRPTLVPPVLRAVYLADMASTRPQQDPQCVLRANSILILR